MNEVLKATQITEDYSQAADKFTRTVPCPRSMNDVYSLAVSLQYCIGDTFLELAELNQGSQKDLYTQLALKQLDAKAEIEKLANANLNRLLSFFYNNGGPIIEPPVTNEQARDIQPFFNRIMYNFYDQLDSIVELTSNDSKSEIDLEKLTNTYIVNMYSTMSKLFRADEIITAFDELIRIRDNF